MALTPQEEIIARNLVRSSLAGGSSKTVITQKKTFEERLAEARERGISKQTEEEGFVGKAGKGIGGFFSGVGKGLLSTVKGAATLGEKVVSAPARALGLIEKEELTAAEDITADIERRLGIERGALTTPTSTAQKIGFGLEQIGEFIVPGGAAAKATKVADLGKGGKFLTRLLGETGVGAGVTALQEGEVGREAAIGAGFGATVPVISGAVNITKKATSGILKGLAGVTTGKGADVIERVIQDPDAARVGLKGNEVNTALELAQKARSSVANLQNEASEAYGASLRQLPTNVRVDKRPILQGVENKLSDFGVRTKNGILDLTESALDDAQTKQIEKAYTLIRNWDDVTPQGMNTLATRISNFERSGPDNAAFNSIIGSMKRSVRDNIGDQVGTQVGPEAAEQFRLMNQEFAKSMDFLDAVRQELALKRGDLSSAQLQKTSRKIQQLFNANKELSRALVDELEERTGVKILGVEAGRQLSEGIGRASASIGDLPRALLQTVIPPRVVGEVAAQYGISRQKAQRLISVLNEFEPNQRALIFGTFSIGRGLER